jgi:hypothetical protein
MSQEWYVNRLGEPQGPVSWDQLVQMAATGELKPDDLIWREGTNDWVPASSVTGLGLQPPPPPPSPAGIVAPYARPERHRAAKSHATPLALGIVFVLALLAAGWIGWALNGGSPRAERRSGGSSAAVAQGETKVASDFAKAREVKPPSAAIDTNPPKNSSTAASAEPLPAKDTTSTDPPPEGSSSSGPQPDPPKKVEDAAGAARKPEELRTTDLKEPPATPTTPPTPTTPTTPPGGRTLFQDVSISRRPTISVAGITSTQDLKYRVFSKLVIGARGSDGTCDVKQLIYETKLEKADGLSEAIFADSLRTLQSQELKYTLSKKNEITKFAGPKDTRKVAKVDGLGGDAMLLTSVLDDDAWRELTQLTFFMPQEPLTKGRRWEQKITHDWGVLGSWYGKSTYAYADTQNGEYRIDYVHRLSYVPPGKNGKGTLFDVASADFKPLQTGGTIYYDAKDRRVTSVTEKFHVRGVVGTTVLGQVATVHVEELQVFSIRLLDQPPEESTPPNAPSKSRRAK